MARGEPSSCSEEVFRDDERYVLCRFEWPRLLIFSLQFHNAM